MTPKTILSALLLLSAGTLTAQAQNLAAKDTITDNHIVPPSSFDTDVKTLQENWYLQRYAVLDNRARRATKAAPSDQVYIERLKKLPNTIEMPFNSVVKKYIEMYALKKPDLVEKMTGMSLYYMPIFEDALEKYQVPNELKYLPVIESALNPNAVSKAGACGLWQFMASTATGEGLEVNSLVDQRRDPIAASEAAAQYLQKLYNMFGDWTLAIAAYNCGPGNVTKAITRAGGAKDYWEIYPFLPEETRGYVPAFIAANYIMTYAPEHGISHALARRPIVTDTVHVTQAVHFQQIADVLGMPIDEIRILNPQYRRDIIPGHIRPYALILPSLQAYCFVANEDSIVSHDRDKYIPRDMVEPWDGQPRLDGNVRTDSRGAYIEELVVKKHTVKKGETLKSIATKYGVTAESIRQANDLSTSKVKTGKVLKINTYVRKYVDGDSVLVAEAAQPAAQATEPAKKPEAKKPEPAKTETKKADNKKTDAKKADTKKAEPKKPKTTTYVVKPGDSLTKIARNHNTTVREIQNANNMKKDLIHPGDKLIIPVK